KGAAQIDRADRISEYVAHAYRIAMAGRPGPVILALPEDMLSARSDGRDMPRIEALPIAPLPAQIATVREALSRAQRPLLLVGGSRLDRHACAALQKLAEQTGLSVACAFRHQDLFDNRHPRYAGDVGIGINPALAA